MEKVEQKIVPIKENDLINFIERIVAEGVEKGITERLSNEKKKWVTETKISVDSRLVERIKTLEKQLIAK